MLLILPCGVPAHLGHHDNDSTTLIANLLVLRLDRRNGHLIRTVLAGDEYVDVNVERLEDLCRTLRQAVLHG